MRFDVVAVGEVMLDVIVPPFEPRRALHAPISVRAGGVPANAALAAAQSGAAVAVVGRVGDDPAAAAIRRALADGGVTALLSTDAGRPTGTFVSSGDAVVADRGANAALIPADVPEPLDARSVLVSGYALLQDDTAAAARAAIERGGLAMVVAAATPILARVGAQRFHELADGAAVVLANREEARVLTGAEPPAAAAELATRYGIACVTADADGAYASAGADVFHLPAAGPPPADTAGTGDAFAGVFLASLVRGDDVEAALAAASRATGARP